MSGRDFRIFRVKMSQYDQGHSVLRSHIFIPPLQSLKDQSMLK